jgi:hypothetical protein
VVTVTFARIFLRVTVVVVGTVRLAFGSLAGTDAVRSVLAVFGITAVSALAVAS